MFDQSQVQLLLSLFLLAMILTPPVLYRSDFQKYQMQSHLDFSLEMMQLEMLQFEILQLEMLQLAMLQLEMLLLKMLHLEMLQLEL